MILAVLEIAALPFCWPNGIVITGVFTATPFCLQKHPSIVDRYFFAQWTWWLLGLELASKTAAYFWEYESIGALTRERWLKLSERSGGGIRGAAKLPKHNWNLKYTEIRYVLPVRKVSMWVVGSTGMPFYWGSLWGSASRKCGFWCRKW